MYHLLIDAAGIPLTVGVSAANTHDSQLLEQLVVAVPAVLGPRGRPGRPGRPRKRPAKLHANKGYDYPDCRRMLRRRGSTPRIARRGVESSQRLGRHRWKVERSLAWLLANRRLTVRYERRADLLTACLQLACTLICAHKLPPL
jgi:IS5 family transposase